LRCRRTPGVRQAVGRHEEGRLQEADRGGTHGQDLVRPAHALCLEVGERDDRVHEAHRQRLVGRVAPAEEPDLLRLLVADEPCQEADPEAGIEAADARAHLAEDRVVARDREVAHHLENLAAADREAVDERDHRDRQRADLALEVQHVETGQPVATDVAAGRALVVVVATGAERDVARPGQQDAADPGVIPDPRERVDHLRDRLRAERVADLGTVDRDLRDPGAGVLVADVAVLRDAGPRDGCGHAA
jgi:hypothetical protein